MKILTPVTVLFVVIIAVALGISTIDARLPETIAEYDRLTAQGGPMEANTNLALKGSQVDPRKILPEEVSRQLAEKAATIAEVQGVDEIGAQRISAHLFLGAAIAMKGLTLAAKDASFAHDPVMERL